MYDFPNSARSAYIALITTENVSRELQDDVYVI